MELNFTYKSYSDMRFKNILNKLICRLSFGKPYYTESDRQL